MLFVKKTVNAYIFIKDLGAFDRGFPGGFSHTSQLIPNLLSTLLRFLQHWQCSQVEPKLLLIRLNTSACFVEIGFWTFKLEFKILSSKLKDYMV